MYPKPAPVDRPAIRAPKLIVPPTNSSESSTLTAQLGIRPRMAHRSGWNSVSDRSREASRSSPIRCMTMSSTSITAKRKNEVLSVCHTTLHTGEPALQSHALISTSTGSSLSGRWLRNTVYFRM